MSDDRKAAEEYYKTRANDDFFSLKKAFLAGIEYERKRIEQSLCPNWKGGWPVPHVKLGYVLDIVRGKK
jgi:hypothetical protein